MEGAESLPGSPEPAPVVVVIPALNEEAAIGAVVAQVPRAQVRAVVVVDNGSTDRTAECAHEAGAVVLSEPGRGYGRACLRALHWCATLEPPPEVVAFLDGDGSDDPSELSALVAPLLLGEVDLMVGSRALGEREPGALLPQQRWGNRLATAWIRLATGVRFTDLGPFRAVTREALDLIGMRDRNYGWTIEMQLKAARAGLRCRELPVRARKRRAGKSKVSGTLRGTLGASTKILWSLARYSFWRPDRAPAGRR